MSAANAAGSSSSSPSFSSSGLPTHPSQYQSQSLSQVNATSDATSLSLSRSEQNALATSRRRATRMKRVFKRRGSGAGLMSPVGAGDESDSSNQSRGLGVNSTGNATIIVGPKIKASLSSSTSSESSSTVGAVGQRSFASGSESISSQTPSAATMSWRGNGPSHATPKLPVPPPASSLPSSSSPSSSRKPLLSLLSSGLFHSHSISSSSASLLSPAGDGDSSTASCSSVLMSSPPPPAPLPKPSRLRALTSSKHPPSRPSSTSASPTSATMVSMPGGALVGVNSGLAIPLKSSNDLLAANYRFPAPLPGRTQSQSPMTPAPARNGQTIEPRSPSLDTVRSNPTELSTSTATITTDSANSSPTSTSISTFTGTSNTKSSAAPAPTSDIGESALRSSFSPAAAASNTIPKHLPKRKSISLGDLSPFLNLTSSKPKIGGAGASVQFPVTESSTQASSTSLAPTISIERPQIQQPQSLPHPQLPAKGGTSGGAGDSNNSEIKGRIAAWSNISNVPASAPSTRSLKSSATVPVSFSGKLEAPSFSASAASASGSGSGGAESPRRRVASPMQSSSMIPSGKGSSSPNVMPSSSSLPPPPPRHPGKTANANMNMSASASSSASSLAVPRKPSAGPGFVSGMSRSASPFRELSLGSSQGSGHGSASGSGTGAGRIAAELVAKGASGGLQLGKRGWDKMGQLWNSGHGHSHSHSGLGTHGGVPGSGSGGGGSGGGFAGPSSVGSSASGSLSGMGDLSTSVYSPGTGSAGPSTGGISKEAWLPGCRRPPRRAGPGVPRAGGLLIGRSLNEVVRDPRVVVGPAVAESDNWVDERGARRGELCPAIVVRCVQHLELWGVQEEGLFRIGGRQLHINRLIDEFDAGADYDLRLSTPADLDPHTVSSALKFYLRSLPEKLLTERLGPAFDVVLNAHNPNLKAEQDLDPLSFTDFFNELRSLISQLPPENRSVLRELCHLLKLVDQAKATTKMHMGNLGLVLYPSIQVPGPLLATLVDLEDKIFRPPEPAPVHEDEDENFFVEHAKLDQLARPTLPHHRSDSQLKLEMLMEAAARGGFGKNPPTGSMTSLVGLSRTPGGTQPSSASVSQTDLSHSSYSPSEVISAATSATTDHTSIRSPASMNSLKASTSSRASHSDERTGIRAVRPAPIMISASPQPSAQDPSHYLVASNMRNSPWQRRSGSNASSSESLTGRERSTENRGPVEHIARPRTPSGFRVLGALLSNRSRTHTNTNMISSPLSIDTVPTSPTLFYGARRGSATMLSTGGSKTPPVSMPGPASLPGTPRTLSRRSSSFFPSSPKPDWGYGSISKSPPAPATASGAGSVALRGRKGSMTFPLVLKKSSHPDPARVSEERETEPGRDKVDGSSKGKENENQAPLLTMSLSGTGAFLSSPLGSPAMPRRSLGAASPPSLGSPTPSPNPKRLSLASSIATNSTKRWSGGSATTARRRPSRASSHRGSWSEPMLAQALAAVDSTPALGSPSHKASLHSPTSGLAVAEFASQFVSGVPGLSMNTALVASRTGRGGTGHVGDSGTNMRSATPIADMFDRSSAHGHDFASKLHLSPSGTRPTHSTSVSLSASALFLDNGGASSSTTQSLGLNSGVRLRSGTLPALSLSVPMHDGVRSDSFPAETDCVTPTSSSTLQPPSPRLAAIAPARTTPRSPNGQVQSAIAALTQAQASLSSASTASLSSGNASPLTPTASLPPRLTIGAIRSKRWSRLPSGAGPSPIASNDCVDPAADIGAGDIEDDWASSVLAQIGNGTHPSSTPLQKSDSGLNEESVHIIRDGVVRDARKMFEAGPRS